MDKFNPEAISGIVLKSGVKFTVGVDFERVRYVDYDENIGGVGFQTQGKDKTGILIPRCQVEYIRLGCVVKNGLQCEHFQKGMCKKSTNTVLCDIESDDPINCLLENV